MKYLNLSILFTVLCYAVSAQTRNQQFLNELIASENAFAQSAADSGTKKAFLMALDGNSINFNEQKPVNGYQLWQKQPDNRKSNLAWYPANAAISAKGDLGFTMGPSIYKPNIDSARSFNSYFFSVWKRNAQGKLKVMLDGGCRRPAGEKIEPKLNDGKPLAARALTYAGKSGTSIAQLENQFIAQWSMDATAAYSHYLADYAWVLRPGKYAGQSKQEDLELVVNPKITQCQYSYAGGGMSQSHDLAYAYGTVALTIQTAAGASKQVDAFYVRTWQKLNNTWKIAGDMLSY
jgi:ketosteroid isomerase-like protein